MRLPNTLVIGPQKAGTSWIHAYLEYRGDVNLPNGVKETFFFDKHFAKGLKWYQKHFLETSSSIITCEVGPTYFENPLVPKRILDTLGDDLKLIVMLRDPANRVWSLYQHELRYGYTKLPFREAVLQRKLYAGSLYADGLRRWKEVLPKSEIKFWSMKKDLAKDAQKFSDELSEFLGLEIRELPEKLKGKVFEGGVAPSAEIARLSTIVGNSLRALQLYPIINIAKRIGLKKAVYGSPESAKKNVLEKADREWLIYEFLGNDIQEFGATTGYDISNWLK